MRVAELSKLRHDLAKRHKASAPAIDVLEFKSLQGFVDARLKPEVGFLAICGGTGVGKTAFLDLIYSALRATDDPAPRNVERLSGCTISLNVCGPDQEYQVRHTIDIEDKTIRTGYPQGVKLISLEARTSLVQQSIASQDFSVVTEGLDFNEIDRKTRNTLSLACKKSYTTARYRELEIGTVICPFFEVEAEGLTYDSRSMATGELSAFYIAWACLIAEPYSILLLEEPEAYLPPLSHAAIFGLITSFSLNKHLGVVFTTHAPSIASEVPERNILPIRRANGKSQFPVGSESKVRTLSRLGMTPARNVVFFVEDKLGQSVLNELLGMFEFTAVAKVEVVIVTDGAGAIRKALDGIPGTISSCSFAGVLDGDMHREAVGWKTKHPLVFLPFAKEMEIEFLESSAGRMQKFSRELNRSENAIKDAFEKSEGKDLHDRFKFLADTLDVSEETLTKVCFNC